LAADRIYKFFTELTVSKKKLQTTNEALKQSEDRFQKLFYSTGDDIFVTSDDEKIIEVNQAATKNLGYSKEEFLKMTMSDIKTKKFAEMVIAHRKKIYELETFTFESEHISKDGKIIPVEITSRLVDYNNEKLILSVSRNIAVRKETERKILSTVIRTEERERERFAKDMHDGLGPLLSTIKLYVNELGSPILEQEERSEFVDQTNEIIDEAIVSTRTISNNLMPRVIHKYGFVKAICSFCDKVNKANRLILNVDKENMDERLNQDLELILFRVITELINNTIKHAQAKNISIKLKRTEKKLSVKFADDGIGFNIEEIMESDHKGMGMKNIISRIKSIKGIYRFEGAKNKGFKIFIDIDL